VTNEFMAVLNLMRTDFKNADRFFAEAEDPEKRFQMIGKHKLGTYTFFFGKDRLPPGWSERLEAEYKASLSRFEKTYDLVSQFECLAGEAGIPFIVVKGIGLNHCIYDADKVRSFGDLDILIRPKDAISLNRILNENGFFQKAGATSSAASSSRYGRAFLALHAKNAGKTHGATPFPIKEHQDKPQYIAYCRQNEPNIEMHEGLYFLSVPAIESMWESAARVTHEKGSFLTLDAAHSFLLLLTNTYENSESFFSNTFDFGVILRDYADLRFFFEKYQKALDWPKVERLINQFEIRNIAGTILGNLLLVYGRDVTYGCLPSVRAAESEWGLNILERAQDADLCRQTVLALTRKRWLDASSVLRVSPAEARLSLEGFYPCAAHKDVFFHVAYTQDAFLLSWAIPPSLQKESGSLLYQFRFFPLTGAMDYTSYKVDFSAYNGNYAVYGHSTKRHSLGAVRKETGPAMPVSHFLIGQTLVIQASLPFRELGISGIPEKACFCLSAEIYKQHYNEIYHRFSAFQADPPMLLIEIRRGI
jgi:hypothetical protein